MKPTKEVVRNALRSRAVNDIMATREGRAWMAELLYEVCNIHATPFTADNPHHTSFACGAQYIGSFISEQIKAFALDKEAKMWLEYQEKENSDGDNDRTDQP